MRIADAHLYRNMGSSIGRAREQLAGAQERASTGVRVSRPSDDPAAAAQARRVASAQKLAESTIKNADLASTRLQAADSALGDVSGLLGRVRELAMQGANSTSNSANRAAAAKEMASIRDQLVALGNTNAAGSFVFGGDADQGAPFTSAGDFVGNPEARNLELLPGVEVKASAPAGRAFGLDGGADVPLLTLVGDLADALANDDVSGLRTKMAGLDRADAQVLEARSVVGTSLSGINVSKSVATRQRDTAATEEARLIDVDEVDAITDFAKAKSALEAAIAIAQKLPTSGLVQGG